MGRLSSVDLKEREEVLVSSVMMAQPRKNSWSELLTLRLQLENRRIASSAVPLMFLAQSEQSCTESPVLVCHG
jgi:hypothetical protein